MFCFADAMDDYGLIAYPAVDLTFIGHLSMFFFLENDQHM
jgi:hypothetical protein